jgi:hypothetical protein
MSSLPDDPLPPIAGSWGAFKAALKALTFSTRDPLGNYREGVAARSREPATASGECSGWSPFDLFRSKKALPFLAMLSAPVSATAAVASLAKGHKGSAPKAAKPAPAAPAAKVTFDATKSPAVTSASTAGENSPKTIHSTRPSQPRSPEEEEKHRQARLRIIEKGLPAGSLVDKNDPRALFQYAVDMKKMSRDDFNRAVDLHCGPGADASKKKEFGSRMLDFLQKREVKVGGNTQSDSGTSPTEKLIAANLTNKALQNKWVSRDDFNTILSNHPDYRSHPGRTAARVKSFFRQRGVKVG